MTNEERKQHTRKKAEVFAAQYKAGKTLQEIGDANGISRERVRQILKKVGVTGEMGGQAIAAKQRAEKAQSMKEANFFEQYGMTQADWLEFKQTKATKNTKGLCRGNPSKVVEPLGTVLNNIIGRCYSDRHGAFYYYGLAGIRCYADWMGYGGFERFKAWAEANGYQPGLEIDRIDGSKHYTPDNLRWVTREENYANRAERGEKLKFVATYDPRCTPDRDSNEERKARASYLLNQRAQGIKPEPRVYVMRSNRKNKLGVRGVRKVYNKYEVIFQGQYLGSFSSPEEAQARYLAEVSDHYHCAVAVA